MRNRILRLLAMVVLLAGSTFSAIPFTAYTDQTQWLTATSGWTHYPCPLRSH